ncbi:hypothetical protein N0V91_009258 [Didymella pomorum]|uniref:Uncharacterized protein n=1 Tax=Didymella pomorum TaxID=749634 RepID=A0A9W8Z9G6_9PLEO|nr:hypothetical protein N0V91_009258 [Didymella pomorum]
MRKVSFETRTVPKRESLTQWKNEREEARVNMHMDHKARMQERVRRANELEQEREKELVEMGKRSVKTESDDEPDYDGDAWADHYEGDGEIDTPEMREEFPEGFI